VATGYHAPWFVGVEQGTFARNGVDLSVVEGRGSTGTVQAVATGQDTFGFADATALPAAVQKGATVKMVCGYQQTTSFAIMFLKDSGIATPKDLEGKRYADAPGSATYLLFPGFLKAAGVDQNRMTILSVDLAGKDRGLLERQYEATFTALNDSFIKLKHQGYDLGAFPYSDYGLTLLAHGLIASDKTLRENPELVRGFVKGWLEAVEIAKADPASAASIAKRQKPDSPDEPVQIDMLREAFARLTTRNTEGKPAGWMAEADWQQTIDLLHQYGALEEKVAPSQLYSNDYLPQAR
jgi:NitT/TauT family transport system substrate-binding protein